FLRGKSFRHFEPYVKSRLRLFEFEPGLVKSLAEYVAPLLEYLLSVFESELIVLERRYARRLHCLKSPGIDVGLDLAEPSHCLRAAHGKTNPPPCHIKRFRQGMKLDSYFFCTVELKEAKRLVSVVRDFRV